MQGKPTKEFLHKLFNDNCISEGILKQWYERWWRRDEAEGILIFNKIVFTIDENEKTVTITLMNDRTKLWNFTETFAGQSGVGSTTFELLSGEMKIRIK